MAPKHLQRRYVAYYRVSTEGQGRSGLGLAAQRHAVEAFISAHDGTLIESFTEVRSGVNGRPKLAAALRRCKLTGATLLIAKLDRLSRNAAFLLTLQESKAKFIACDLPDMNEMTIGILAVVAQAERKAISDRTIAALAAAKANGVKLGNPRLKPGSKRTAAHARAALSAKAKSRAEDLRELVDDATAQGCLSLRQIADHLNEINVTTPRGGQWSAIAVSRLLAQLAAQ